MYLGMDIMHLIETELTFMYFSGRAKFHQVFWPEINVLDQTLELLFIYKSALFLTLE